MCYPVEHGLLGKYILCNHVDVQIFTLLLSSSGQEKRIMVLDFSNGLTPLCAA